MTKGNLIDLLTRQMDISRPAAERIIDALADCWRSALLAGDDDALIPGIGKIGIKRGYWIFHTHLPGVV